MKKSIYYAAPVVIFPFLFLLGQLMYNTISEAAFLIIMPIVFCLVSALMGNLSPMSRKFDYLMTIFVPISLFFALFVDLLFLNAGCFGRLSGALDIESYKAWSFVAAAMMITTFVASFKPIRIAKKLWCTAKAGK